VALKHAQPRRLCKGSPPVRPTFVASSHGVGKTMLITVHNYTFKPLQLYKILREVGGETGDSQSVSSSLSPR
jgi:hypothetical protein